MRLMVKAGVSSNVLTRCADVPNLYFSFDNVITIRVDGASIDCTYKTKDDEGTCFASN